jgi:long-chain acyl-CoA synthetase
MNTAASPANPRAAPAAADDAAADFRDWPSLLAEHARVRPQAPALRQGSVLLSYGALQQLTGRVAAALQRRGLGPGDVLAVCAEGSLAYVVLFIGALRAGVAVAPLAPSGTDAQLARMAEDCSAKLVAVDAPQARRSIPWPAVAQRALLADSPQAEAALSALVQGGGPGSADGAQPEPVTLQPQWPFNIIYSSGTTGTPKGIVQPHAMRWAHIRRAAFSGYGPQAVVLIATPLYSNTTLVSLIPALAYGGCVVLMPKFDALAYLQLAQQHRATHTMLVPVQYQRLLAHPEFSRFDLSSFSHKFSTSAPFHAELKAQVLRRWPGGLTELYGLTEGGGTCFLHAHLHPEKLHTVGQPAPGHDIRLIDDEGVEIQRAPGGASVSSGEVVGRSPGMMTGYHGQPELTRAAEWFNAEGQRFIRTGDVGRFDEDGFLVLHDRRKDMIISGGFNIYPSDLEAVLRAHPSVVEVAVVGVPSIEWGETPVAFCVLQPGAPAGTAEAEELQAWANGQLGKTQRLSALRLQAELPRSAIGKVLKRELRDAWVAAAAKPGS